MPGALILINGFPGVGKHAVAADKLLPNCQFLDTRTFDPASEAKSEGGGEVDGVVGANLKHPAVFKTIARACAAATPSTPTSPTLAIPHSLHSPRLPTAAPPSPPIFVLTDFLSVAARQDDLDTIHSMIDFAVSSGLVFIHVILSCSLDANVTRVVDPGRIALNEALKLQGYAAVAAEITTDPEALVTTRMEEEIGHVAPFLKGLSGEYELETTLMDAKTAAGVLAEYCLDTLRREGWWIQLNSMMRK